MPQRVTDFRIDCVEIDEANFYRLPAKTQELIRAYGSPVIGRPGFVTFELPVYRWEEINRSMEAQ